MQRICDAQSDLTNYNSTYKHINHSKHRAPVPTTGTSDQLKMLTRLGLSRLLCHIQMRNGFNNDIRHGTRTTAHTNTSTQYYFTHPTADTNFILRSLPVCNYYCVICWIKVIFTRPELILYYFRVNSSRMKRNKIFQIILYYQRKQENKPRKF